MAQELFNLIYKPTVDVVSDGTVRLRAIAIDSEGVPVKGLTTDDFQVAEESIPQRFAVSVNNDATSIIGLAVDASGSLRSGFPLLVASAKVILNGIKPQDETLLVRFIDRDKIEVMQDFTSDKTILTKAIDSLYVEGGQSAVVDAVYVCAQRVAGYRFPDDSVHRVLLLLTDGEDRASFYSIDQLVALLRKIDVQIFAISFSVDETGKKLNQNQPRKSAELLQRVAAETGGKVYFPKSIPELRTAINEMVGLLSDEYLIQYKPTQSLESGNYRQTAVTLVKRPGRERWGLAVRSGYLFSKKQAPH